MTGYGAATAESENFRVRVELKSLNSKFLEIGVKLPQNYLEYELSLRNILSQKAMRGKIMGSVSVEVVNPDLLSLRINEERLAVYVSELKALANKHGISDDLKMEFLLSLPNVVADADDTDDPEEWRMIEQAFTEAADALVVSRAEEGRALERDLNDKCEQVLIHLAEVNRLLPQRMENIRSRLQNALSELKEKVQIDENRFEQEILFYLEKTDINEEIVRLKKHVDYFFSTLKEKESNGRRLGFIAQEMGREINTIGAKANDALIQVSVVKMKDELEKIKEQINNIL